MGRQVVQAMGGHKLYSLGGLCVKSTQLHSNLDLRATLVSSKMALKSRELLIQGFLKQNQNVWQPQFIEM